MSRDSLDVRSDWACHTCHHTVTADHVTNTGQAARQLMSGLDTSDCHQLEELLYRLGRLLHHSHHLLVQAEYIQYSTVQYSTVHLLFQAEQQLLVSLVTSHRLARPDRDRRVQLCHNVLRSLSSF